MSLGGLGLSLAECAEVSAALGESPVRHYLLDCRAPDVGNMELLHAFGTPEQRARWLHPLAAGEVRSCFAMTEPEFPSSNPVLLGTRRDADASWYSVFGVFKPTVVAQQIHARYAAGHACDPRFVRLDAVVAALGRQAERVVTFGRLDRLG